MNNDILYEVVKYVEVPINSPRAADVQGSAINSRRMMRLNTHVLEKKLSARPTIDDLRLTNIYRECSVDFSSIHSALSTLFYRRGDPPFPDISPAIANTARTMDFKLRRVLLISRLRALQ